MKRGEKGVSMLEVLIASVILMTVVAMVYVILSNATSQVAKDSVVMAMQEKSRQLLEELTEQIHMAQASGLQTYNQSKTALSSTTFTSNAITTPVDPLGIASTLPNNSPYWMIPAVPTGFKRIYELEFDTLGTSTAGKEMINGVAQTGNVSTKTNFDFSTNKPRYTHHVIYKLILEPTTIQAGLQETTIDGLDDNKNIMIDERILTKQEYDTYPSPPSTLPGAKRVGFNLRNLAFEIPTTGAFTRVIIHVLFQGVNDKGKLVHYYTQTSVAARN